MNFKNFEAVLEILAKDRKIYEIFKDCPYSILKTVKLKKYPNGSFCLEQDEAHDKFYIVVDGEVDIFIESDFGKKYYLNTYEKGRFIGELEMFERHPYVCMAKGRGTVTTLEMDGDKYLEWLDKDPNFSQYVLRMLCNITYGSVQKMANDTLYTLKQRICQYLLENAADRGKSAMMLNVEVLSERMGVTSRSVNRVLKELKDKGVLEISNSQVVIKDRGQLLKEKNEK